MRTSFGSLGHLARRFFTSLRPGGPGVAGDAWAQRWLSRREREIWVQLSGPDRRHAVDVAHKTAATLGNRDGTGVTKAAIAAALMHDAGKAEAGLGTFGRSAATVAAVAAGRGRATGWATTGTGWARRVGLYVSHDRIGAEMLAAAGSDPLVAAWAGEHHLPSARWSVDPAVAAALKAADDD